MNIKIVHLFPYGISFHKDKMFNFSSLAKNCQPAFAFKSYLLKLSSNTLAGEKFYAYCTCASDRARVTAKKSGEITIDKSCRDDVALTLMTQKFPI